MPHLQFAPGEGGEEEEWVVLHEPIDAKASRLSTLLRDSESGEHILGNGIKISKTILLSVTYPEND